MAHLLSQEVQEEVLEAETSAQETVQPLEEEVVHQAPETGSPPSDPTAMAYELGTLRTEVATLRGDLMAALALVQQQQGEIAATEAQVEVQEEIVADLAEENEEECQGENPPLWCRLLGGHRRQET